MDGFDQRLDATLDEGFAEPAPAVSQTVHVLSLMIDDLCAPVDRPEMWSAFPQFLTHLPNFREAAEGALVRANAERRPARLKAAIEIVIGMCEAHSGELDAALRRLTRVATVQNQSPVAQGALFHVQGMMDPQNPKYRLEGRFCTKPFSEFHVLEQSSHLCCASWLPESVGDLNHADWTEVWNSNRAQMMRASIHDGSFRHCNKTACPAIQAGMLPTADEVAARSETLAQIIENKETSLDQGPVDVNLSYDRTCNLSCPSCRGFKYAADEETRQRYARLQERNILPMLEHAKTVFITGSGDPFASKNFRRLMEDLADDRYSDLKFRIMTNGMLLTPREWERFPALHGRVFSLQISLDGASKETHELLRRGARWEVMERNLEFASSLRQAGLVEHFQLSFTVQVENFHEMGQACDLAERLNATHLYFGRVTNWGTFTPEQYAQKAVFTPGHPQFDAFLSAMADPRLRSPIVMLGNLSEFLPEARLAA